jgi:sialic acid synthase SpsE
MDGSFRIEGRDFGPGRVLVIAEIGTSHGGDLGKARALVDAAAWAGADCVKFQCVFAREILHPKTGGVPLPGGVIPLFERFEKLERGPEFYAAVKKEVEARGLLFLCTPFGLRSARLLRDIGVEVMKVASPELNHHALLDELASYGLPTILSTGVSTLADIERARARFTAPTALLHCVTAYPAPPQDYNLRLVSKLSAVFGLPVGVSDHSADPVLVPSLAVALGAMAVEKHICLSRDESGLDDPIALPPSDFAAMVSSVREAQAGESQRTIDSLSSRFGPEIVVATMGDGVKRLAPSEAENYARTNRSIHSLREIAIGETFTEANLALLRTEKVLRPGLDPSMLGFVLGRRARRIVSSGEGIQPEDVGDIADDE